MKNELEMFPRKYDKFFSDPDTWIKNCSPQTVTLAEPYNKYLASPLDILVEYQDDFAEFVHKSDKLFWTQAIGYEWFRKRFGYRARSYYRGDWDRSSNFAYGIFLRHFVGIEKDLYYHSAGGGMSTVKAYYDDFIDAAFDPRVEESEFPYPELNLAHMAMVQEMDERLEILDYANDNKMKYNEFCDFVANWVSCYNEKYGEKYQVQLKRRQRMAGVENLMKKGSAKGEVEYGE